MTEQEVIDIFVNDVMFDENHDEDDKEYLTRIAKYIYKLIVKRAESNKAKEILGDLKGLLNGYVCTENNISLYEYYCKKYGVR